MPQESPTRSIGTAPSTTPVSMTGAESAAGTTTTLTTTAPPITTTTTTAADTTTTTTTTAPATATESATPAASKPKRVRTGCLTCRERHLKCDEGLPHCQNCRKSNRKCKRGVRLNFIDIDCKRPPYFLPPTHDWRVSFQDDSRDIANEYKGGLERYLPLEPSPKRRRMSPPEPTYDYNHGTAPTMEFKDLPPPPYHQTFAEAASTMYAASTGTPVFDAPNAGLPAQMPTYHDQPRASFDQSMMPSNDAPEHPPPFLSDYNETFYMQVFVEEVAIWMDSMDADKYFSQLLPFQALRQPMLKHAALACGIRHLTLINPSYQDEHAVHYYNQATQALLKSLQNPDRDTVLCATTATVLNVYEIMCENALQRMNHIAGARALIKECRWDATTTGIGGACFWLNVGMEMFSCLYFNWGVAWDPDTWGIDMTMTPQAMGGNEEDWTHKMLYILAKITNYRSSVPQFQEPSMHAEQLRLQQRHQAWLDLKHLCDSWDRCVPPTMHPMACIQPYAGSVSKSSFPEVWYIKRATIVARLFYHTALAILGAVHPMADLDPSIGHEMELVRTHHSRQICGIVTHVKDRGVASASIRSLAIAAENLTVRQEQDEVLKVFERINQEAGWRVRFIQDDLREKWGWNTPASGINGGASAFYQGGNATMPTPTPTPSRPKVPSGIINPIYKHANFSTSNPNPPYKGNYVPPNISSAPINHMLHAHSHGPGHAHNPTGHTAQAHLYGY